MRNCKPFVKEALEDFGMTKDLWGFDKNFRWNLTAIKAFTQKVRKFISGWDFVKSFLTVHSLKFSSFSESLKALSMWGNFKLQRLNFMIFNQKKKLLIKSKTFKMSDEKKLYVLTFKAFRCYIQAFKALTWYIQAF